MTNLSYPKYYSRKKALLVSKPFSEEEKILSNGWFALTTSYNNDSEYSLNKLYYEEEIQNRIITNTQEQNKPQPYDEVIPETDYFFRKTELWKLNRETEMVEKVLNWGELFDWSHVPTFGGNYIRCVSKVLPNSKRIIVLYGFSSNGMFHVWNFEYDFQSKKLVYKIEQPSLSGLLNDKNKDLRITSFIHSEETGSVWGGSLTYISVNMDNIDGDDKHNLEAKHMIFEGVPYLSSTAIVEENGWIGLTPASGIESQYKFHYFKYNNQRKTLELKRGDSYVVLSEKSLTLRKVFKQSVCNSHLEFAGFWFVTDTSLAYIDSDGVYNIAVKNKVDIGTYLNIGMVEVSHFPKSEVENNKNPFITFLELKWDGSKINYQYHLMINIDGVAIQHVKSILFNGLRTLTPLPNNSLIAFEISKQTTVNPLLGQYLLSNFNGNNKTVTITDLMTGEVTTNVSAAQAGIEDIAYTYSGTYGDVDYYVQRQNLEPGTANARVEFTIRRLNSKTKKKLDNTDYTISILRANATSGQLYAFTPSVVFQNKLVVARIYSTVGWLYIFNLDTRTETLYTQFDSIDVNIATSELGIINAKCSAKEDILWKTYEGAYYGGYTKVYKISGLKMTLIRNTGGTGASGGVCGWTRRHFFLPLLSGNFYSSSVGGQCGATGTSPCLDLNNVEVPNTPGLAFGSARYDDYSVAKYNVEGRLIAVLNLYKKVPQRLYLVGIDGNLINENIYLNLDDTVKNILNGVYLEDYSSYLKDGYLYFSTSMNIGGTIARISYDFTQYEVLTASWNANLGNYFCIKNIS